MTPIKADHRWNNIQYLSLFLTFAGIWTALALSAVLWDHHDRSTFLVSNALSSARAIFEKDVAFRRWASMHGGVYVPVTTETPPNPYLKVPERDISTPAGKHLTLMNPAYMTRQVYEISRSNPTAPQGHITSLRPIRPANAPDAWERSALEAFEKGATEFSALQSFNDSPVFRFMRPLAVDKPCLACHAGQGYREGDIRGGISVTIPVANLVAATNQSGFQHTLFIGIVWVLGTSGLWFGLRRIRRDSLALQAERNNLHTIFDASPVGVALIDKTLKIVRMNRAARTVFTNVPESIDENMRCGEMLGCRNHSSCPEGCGFAQGCGVCGVMVAIRQTFRDATSMPHEECYMDVERSGAPAGLWLNFSTTPINLDGTDYVLLSLEDISDLKRTEQALLEKMDFTENLLQNSTTPTFVLDVNHTVLIWNRALAELTGVKAQEVVGTNEQWRAFYPSARPCLADIVLDGHLEEAAELYLQLSPSRLIPDGLHAEGDFSFDKRRCRLVFSAAPIRDRDGRIIAVIQTLEDITERISLESQLFHAQKMESVGVLAGGIAHDFNNVLTVISGYAGLLQLTTRGDERNQHIANEIADSVERAADMTRSLLAFSGKHEMKLQYDDLNQILSAIRKSMNRLIREDIILSIQPGQEQLQVYVDRVQIEQVLINLVINARDALGTGGTITVTTMLAAHEEAHVEGTTVIPPGRYACLCVGDSGFGMDATTIERIFEPFFTTKEKGKGTGLGLSIVHSITSKHDGFISVTSTPGVGTEFRVYLPLYTGQLPRKQSGVMQTINYHGTETLLIVEDDNDIMKLHNEVLSRYGYTVISARDGVEALELFSVHRDEIQAAIVDVIMPRMNGRELVERIRQQRAGLPIILTSGYTDEIIDRAAIDQLKITYLQKPVKPLDLLAAIRSCFS